MQVPLNSEASAAAIADALLIHVPKERKEFLGTFLESILKLYRGLHFVYMEVNPLVRERSCLVIYLSSFSASR